VDEADLERYGPVRSVLGVVCPYLAPPCMFSIIGRSQDGRWVVDPRELRETAGGTDEEFRGKVTASYCP
jgi:hypothetical protein